MSKNQLLNLLARTIKDFMSKLSNKEVIDCIFYCHDHLSFNTKVQTLNKYTRNKQRNFAKSKYDRPAQDKSNNIINPIKRTVIPT